MAEPRNSWSKFHIYRRPTRLRPRSFSKTLVTNSFKVTNEYNDWVAATNKELRTLIVPKRCEISSYIQQNIFQFNYPQKVHAFDLQESGLLRRCSFRLETTEHCILFGGTNKSATFPWFGGWRTFPSLRCVSWSSCSSIPWRVASFL